MSTATARATLAAEHRDVTGKKVSHLRHAGRLPAVVYGHGDGLGRTCRSTPTSSSSSAGSIGSERPRRPLDRRQEGAAGPRLGVQVHPVNRRPLHVDLFLVRMTEELTVDVPLVAIGESPAVTMNGGTLLHPIETVRVRALPDHLPQSIEYSIESLVDFDATHPRPRPRRSPRT